MKPDMSGFAEDPCRLLEKKVSRLTLCRGVNIANKGWAILSHTSDFVEENQRQCKGYFRKNTALYYDCIVFTSKISADHTAKNVTPSDVQPPQRV